MNQNIADILALIRRQDRTGGSGSIEMQISDLRSLVAAAEYGDRIRWERMNDTPQLIPGDVLVHAIKVKLAAMSARGELPSLRVKDWQARDDARAAIASKLAEALATEFVFAHRFNAAANTPMRTLPAKTSG
jgi:hypothetical protein